MDLFDQISNDIKEAMKAKDKGRLETLRNVKKVFLEAKTAPGANDVLTDDTALKLMQKLVKQGKDSAESYTNAGRPELAEAEMAQVKVIETYLPKQLSAEELEAKLKEIIARTGATSGKDMGKVMGVASKELAGLAEVLAKHERVIVVADEIYEHINYIGKHQSIAQFEEIRDRVVIVNGVSKAYAMTGWRIGFVAGPEWIVKGINKLQGQYTSGPCSVSQKAAEAAYTGTQEPVEEMRKAFERRRDLIVKLAKEIPGFEVNFPQGAFYLFPKCDSFYGKKDGDRVINNADDLAMYLLEVGHVACVGGTSFGAPECIRMSYATSDENIVEAMRLIKETLAKLK